MSVSYVQSKSVLSGASVTSLGVTITGVVSGNHLSSWVTSNVSTTSVTTSTPANTWSVALADFNTFAAVHARADYLEGVASGSWTVTANHSPTNLMTMGAVECSGAATSSSLGVSGTGTAASTSTSLTAALTPTAGSIFITAITDDGGSGNSAGTLTSTGNTPFTVTTSPGGGSDWDDNTGVVQGTAYFNNVAASSTNPTWTSHNTSVTEIGIWMVEFKAPAAAGLPPGLGPDLRMDTATQSAQAAMMR